MGTFFENLKNSRDLSQEQPQESAPNAPTSGSFFSSLKQKRQIPIEQPLQQDVDLQYGRETVPERIKHGAKDVVQQATTHLPSSIFGTYGDLTSLVGLNPSKEELVARQTTEYPKYTDDESDFFVGSRLPTRSEIKEKIEKSTGIGKPTTPEGHYTARTSDIYGGNLAFGQLNPIPSFLAGGAGETTKYLGGGPVAQAIAEIATLLITQGKSAISALTSKNPQIKSRIDDLRQLGYADQDITLALNAEKATLNRVKTAKATSSSEKAFESTLGKSEGLFEEVLESSFPGYGKGSEHLHEVASEAYGKVAREARNIVVKDPSRFHKTVDNVIKRVKTNLGENPEAQPFVKRLEDAWLSAIDNPSAERYINFYRELNKIGKWVNPKERERLITHVKNGIKSTFRDSGKEGKQLAEKFEQVNKGIQRAYQAEDVSDLLQKAHTAEGLDWKKMLKLFDKKNTWETLEAGLGKQQTKNLYEITKVAKDVGDFSKALGSKYGKSLIDKTGSLAPVVGAFASILTHIPKYAIIGLGVKGATSVGKQTYSRLQTRLLTDPKFQNITLRFMKAFKEGHPRALSRAAQDFQQIAEDEGIDLNQL